MTFTFYQLALSNGSYVMRPYVVLYDNMLEIHLPRKPRRDATTQEP